MRFSKDSTMWLPKKDNGFSELRKHIADLLDGCNEVTILSATSELIQESRDDYDYSNPTNLYKITSRPEYKEIYREFNIKSHSEIDQGQDRNTIIIVKEGGQSIAIIVVCKGMYYIDGEIFTGFDFLDTKVLKWILL